MEQFKIINGDMLNEIDKIDENSIDCIITDPPYELGFMNKDWDNAGISFNKSTWEKCLRVLKPGGHMVVFGGSRTFHRIACAIEDAGFEIRDTIMWLYGSGFPKSMNIGLAIDKKNGVESKVIGQNQNILVKQAKDLREGHRKIVDSLNAGADERNNGFISVSADIKEPVSEDGKKWQGWGTCLKPSFEPIILARKPFDGSLIDNVLNYNVGGINIDECRISTNGELIDNHKTAGTPFMRKAEDYKQLDRTKSTEGRFPANTILTYDETDYEEVCGGFPISGSGNNGEIYNYAGREYNNKATSMFNGDKPQAPSNYNDIGSASRYFYCAKASIKDRDEGLDKFEEKQMYRCDGSGNSLEIFGTTDGGRLPRKNFHPTVKPTELMQYLVRLISPKEAIILDPFMGSGSTGKAVMYENNERDANYKFIGIEREKEYCDIANARIQYACGNRVVEKLDATTGVVTQVVEQKLKQNKLF